MGRLLIIANPAASGFTGAALRTATNALGRRYEVDTAWPTSAAGSREAAAAAASQGYEVVAAMGGDGVAHHVAQGLVARRTDKQVASGEQRRHVRAPTEEPDPPGQAQIADQLAQAPVFRPLPRQP